VTLILKQELKYESLQALFILKSHTSNLSEFDNFQICTEHKSIFLKSANFTMVMHCVQEVPDWNIRNITLPDAFFDLQNM
jgi:hypothetical protein